MTKSKYKREYEIRQDKQQTQLNPKTPSFTKIKQEPKIDIKVAYTGEYHCPFCLHKDRIEKYLISTKKGYHKGLGKCPECGNQFTFKTLTADMTPEQFAEFMFEYSTQGGWQKVPFKKFNERLKQIGWARRFWDTYRRLKGEDDTESYQEYMERTQKEWAEEEGLTEE